MNALRRLRAWIRRGKPWLERVLNALDWADWKTWIWYGVLGTEKLSLILIRWAKRRYGQPPADIRYVNGKFLIVSRRTPGRAA